MKLALIGYGRMGHAVETIARERGHEIGPIFDGPGDPDAAGITAQTLGSTGMAIDFSTAEAVRSNITRLAELGASAVVGTTGWEDDREAVESAVREAGTGLLHAPNFSLGMLVFTRIVAVGARMMNHLDQYDAALSETHHRHKVDHPGGTARRLAETLVRELDRKSRWSADLPADHAVDPDLLQVAVSRVGEVPGIHAVRFDGPDDHIELRHEARTRTGFARGAVIAAEWLEGRSGVFTMDDLMADLLGSDPSGPR